MTDRRAGFTLIEILVVLAILGLALTMIVSWGQPVSGAMVLRHAAAEVAAGLREARSLAIADNRPVNVTLDLAARRFSVDGKPGSPLPAGVDINLLTIAGDTAGGRQGVFRFLPDGSATGGRIEFVGANRRIQIGIDWLSGRVRQIETP